MNKNIQATTSLIIADYASKQAKVLPIHADMLHNLVAIGSDHERAIPYERAHILCFQQSLFSR